jgi:hypothetical protein
MVRSHCCFRNRGTEYISESGINWMRPSSRPTTRAAADGHQRGTGVAPGELGPLVHRVERPLPVQVLELRLGRRAVRRGVPRERGGDQGFVPE